MLNPIYFPVLLVLLGVAIVCTLIAVICLHVLIFGAKHDEQTEGTSTQEAFEAEHRRSWSLCNQGGTKTGRFTGKSQGFEEVERAIPRS